MKKGVTLNQKKKTLQELERPLEVPKFGDMICSTPASVDICQGAVHKAQGITPADAKAVPTKTWQL